MQWQISLILAAAIFALQLYASLRIQEQGAPHSSKRFFTLAILCAGLLLFLHASDAYRQWVAWAADPLGQYLLPPHRSASYFASYVFSRIFAPFLLSIFAAAAAGSLAGYLNRKFGGRFLEAAEPYLLGMGILLAGYPGFLMYGALLFLAAVILSLVFTVLRKGPAPLYFLWLPTAILAILINKFLIPESILARFNF